MPLLLVATLAAPNSQKTPAVSIAQWSKLNPVVDPNLSRAKRQQIQAEWEALLTNLPWLRGAPGAPGSRALGAQVGHASSPR